MLCRGRNVASLVATLHMTPLESFRLPKVFRLKTLSLGLVWDCRSDAVSELPHGRSRSAPFV